MRFIKDTLVNEINVCKYTFINTDINTILQVVILIGIFIKYYLSGITF